MWIFLIVPVLEFCTLIVFSWFFQNALSIAEESVLALLWPPDALAMPNLRLANHWLTSLVKEATVAFFTKEINQWLAKRPLKTKMGAVIAGNRCPANATPAKCQDTLCTVKHLGRAKSKTVQCTVCYFLLHLKCGQLTKAHDHFVSAACVARYF